MPGRLKLYKWVLINDEASNWKFKIKYFGLFRDIWVPLNDLRQPNAAPVIFGDAVWTAYASNISFFYNFPARRNGLVLMLRLILVFTLFRIVS